MRLFRGAALSLCCVQDQTAHEKHCQVTCLPHGSAHVLLKASLNSVLPVNDEAAFTA
jgi:hypothetical protein